MSKSRPLRATPAPKRSWPAGDSEMAERIRTFDWAATPLGPIEVWPQCLRTAVDVCLGSAFPSWVDWGRDLIQIYNDAAIAVLRAKHPKALGTTARQNWADVWDVTGPLIERVMAAGEAVRVEDLAMMPNRGGPLEAAYFTLSLSALRDKAGRIAGLLVTAIETTDRVQAMRAQRASERRLRRVLETDAVGIIFFDYAGSVLDANKAFLKMTGYSREDVTSGRLTWRAMTPPEWVAASREQMAKLTATGRIGPYEKEYLRPDGSRCWMHFTGRDLGDGTIVEYCIDIDGRKRTEAALRESEERQRFLLALGDAMRAQTDTNAIIEAAARLLGERLNASRIMFAEFDEERGVADIFHGWFADGAKPFPAVMRLEDYDGPILNDLRAGRTVRIDDAGPPFERPDLAAIAELGVKALLGVPLLAAGRLKVNLSVHQHAARHWTDDEVALVQEVAERLWADLVRARAETALRVREEKYRSVFESIDEGFCIWEVVHDAEERIVDLRFLKVNPAFERQTGLSGVMGRLVSEVAPGTEAEWIATYGEVARTGETKRFEMYHDDTGRWYDIYASRLDGPDNPRVSIVFKDISERKRAERALRESEERQAFLLKLSDALREEADARAIAATSIGLLADHMRLDRAYVAQVDKGRDVAEVGPEHRRPDLAPVEGVLTLSNFPEAFARVEAATLVLADAAADPTLSERDKRGFATLRMGALIVASARKGARNPVWALLVAMEEPRRWTAAEVALVEETAERTWAAVERARAEAALRDSEERFRQFGQASTDVLWIRDAETLRMEYLGPAFEAIYGESRDRVLHEDPTSWTELTVPDDRNLALANLERVRKGESVEFEFRIQRPSDGEVRWLRNIDFPLLDAKGRVQRIGGIGQDITERKRTAERMEIMVAELQHRTRNLLTVVRGLAQQTMKSSASLEDFKAHFDDRLSALSRVQGLLSRANRERITIGALLRMELAALGAEASGDRVTLAGPDVPLRNSIVQTLSLAVHELATNARKYGALATQNGKLTITWSVSTEEDRNGRRLLLEWIEEGGNSIGSEAMKSPRSGYGRQLIERALPYSLGAKTSLAFGASGVSCIIDLPLDRPKTAEAT